MKEIIESVKMDNVAGYQMNLQLFAEGDEPISTEPEPQTIPEGQEQVTDENSGIAPTKPVQTPDENAKYAAARREAEEREKKLREQMEEDAKSLGYTSYDDYRKAIEQHKKQKEEAEKAKKVEQYGYDPDELIEKKFTELKQKDPDFIELQEIRKRRGVETAIKSLNEAYGLELKNEADLNNLPNANEISQYLSAGLDIVKAYKAANLDSIMNNENQSEQVKINSQSKSHIKPSAGSTPSNLHDVVPPEIVKEWEKSKKHFPRKTYDDFVKIYKKLNGGK